MAPFEPNSPTVLLVDDEDCIRTAVGRVLARAGYAVTIAASGTEALERVRARTFSAVICDLRMPGLSGLALVHRLQQAAPALAGRILVASGDLTQADVADFLRRSGAPSLLKPYSTLDLLEALRRLWAPPSRCSPVAAKLHPGLQRAGS